MRVSALLASLLALLLALSAGSAPLAAQSDRQAVRKATSAFQKAARGKDASAQKAAVDALAATGHPDALKAFMKELGKISKPLLKQDKAIALIGKKRSDIWDSIDKQAAKGRPISVGSVQGAQRKAVELQEEERELLAERNRLFAWRARLIEGSAEALRAAEDPAPMLETVARAAEKGRSVADVLPAIRILGSWGSETARTTLVGLLATSRFPEARVTVVDALAEIGGSDSIPALGRALEDEAWTVRVSAVRALGTLSTPDAIQPLMTALDKADGRTKEEIVESLEDLSGRTSAQNVTLWKDWWSSSEKTIRETLEGLRSDNEASRVQAISRLGRGGSFMAVDALLELLGLGAKETEQTPTITDADQRRLAFSAIGQAITKAPKKIRDRGVSRMFNARLGRSSDVDRRIAFLEALSSVQTPRVRQLLLERLGKESITKPDGSGDFTETERERLRVQAIRSLGGQGSKTIIQPLQGVLDESSAPRPRKKAAIEALGQLRLKEAIPALLRGLILNDDDLKALAKTQLEGLTGESHPAEYRAWRDWWRENQNGFVVKGAPPEVDAREEAEARKTGFYGIETESKHVMYVIDRSASMTTTDGGKGGSRWASASQELIRAIRALKDDATFNIVFYNHEYSAWKRGMVKALPKTRAAAVKWIESLEPAGNTNIFDPLAFGLEQAKLGQRDGYGDPVDTIFFLSDGQPNRGDITNPNEILREIARRNATLKVQIHAIGLGDGHDAGFMRRLAESNGGSYVGI